MTRFAFAALAVACVAAPARATIVASDITSDTTWNVAGNPYQVTASISVTPGVTLTVEPGALVEFAQSTGVTVEGTLLARGTAAAPITFTGSTQTPGWWSGVTIASYDTAINRGSIIEHAVFEYGGEWYANLDLYWAEVVLRDVIIRHSSQDGIYCYWGGYAHLDDIAFNNNVGAAIYYYDPADDPRIQRVTATGNGIDAIRYYQANITGKHVWEDGGLPYQIESGIDVAPDSTLVIEPGVEVRFENQTGLSVEGTLTVVGRADAMVTFTGSTQTPGWWEGIEIFGPVERSSGSVIDHAIIEYGGNWYANVYLNWTQATITNSIIRHSSADGIYGNYAGGSVIERSQLVNNTGHAINNYTNDLMLAANNWWGDASGPTHAECNPSGTGSSISGPVAVAPFLTSPDEDPGPLAPGDARILTLEPNRWYAPANGITRVWVTLTLHDGAGRPLPGRTVLLQSDHGFVVDGGVTDITGQTFAYLTADAAGDAELAAVLDFSNTCETARAATARVTFTEDAQDELLPEGAAPYLNERIEVIPEPIIRGVPTVFRAHLTNPSDSAISVDATFSFAQYGIGLTFGPAGEVVDYMIPAASDGVVEIEWTPVVSGSYCVEFLYTAQPVTPFRQPAGYSYRSMRNLSVLPGPMGSKNEKESIQKSQDIIGGFGAAQFVLDVFTAPANLIGGLLPSLGVSAIIDFNFHKWTEVSKALGSDPPRQDYDLYAEVVPYTFTPMVADVATSQARVDASNALVTASLDLTAKGVATTTSLDRYGGAAAAEDLLWSSQQAAAYLYYKRETGDALVVMADRIDNFLAVLRAEGATDINLREAELVAYQNRLASTGFTPEELAAADLLEFSTEELEELRQQRMALDPALAAGSVFDRLEDLSDAFRELGVIMANPDNFPAPAGGGRDVTDADVDLVRLYEVVDTVEVGNPLLTTETIELSARAVDLPADWSVSIEPTSVTLAPAAQATVTIKLRAGAAAVQGTRVRVAIEGHVGSELIGGVVQDVLVPRNVPLHSGCNPGPALAEGEVCACPLECADGLACAPDGGGGSACLSPCDRDAPDCPHDGQQCSEQGVCLPPGGIEPEAGSSSTEDGCGCNSGHPIYLFLLLPLLLRRGRNSRTG